MIAEELIKKHRIISEQVDARELSIVLSKLERSLLGGRQGNVVEFGCYIGTTSLFIARLLSQFNGGAAYHVYDSFEGLPEKSAKDASAVGDQFVKGELLATKNQFVANFKKAGLQLPKIHKGWFADIQDQDVPDDIMFAFLDGDYYDSIKDSLNLIGNKLSDQSVIIIDDYSNEALPGAGKAVDEWLSSRQNFSLKVQSSLAIITQHS